MKKAIAKDDRTVTKWLLAAGIIAGPLFLMVPLIEMFTRPGFDIKRHAISMLSLGNLGWIQITTFILTGLLTVACAVGMRLALRGSRGGNLGAVARRRLRGWHDCRWHLFHRSGSGISTWGGSGHSFHDELARYCAQHRFFHVISLSDSSVFRVRSPICLDKTKRMGDVLRGDRCGDSRIHRLGDGECRRDRCSLLHHRVARMDLGSGDHATAIDRKNPENMRSL